MVFRLIPFSQYLSLLDVEKLGGRTARETLQSLASPTLIIQNVNRDEGGAPALDWSWRPETGNLEDCDDQLDIGW